MSIEEYVKKITKEKEDLGGYSFPEDIIRIKNVMKTKGVELTTEEADELWNIHSDDYCAQWLGLPDDDEKLVEIIIEAAKKKYLGA